MSKTLSTVLFVSFVGIFVIMVMSPLIVEATDGISDQDEEATGSSGDQGEEENGGSGDQGGAPIEIKNPLKWNNLQDLILGLVDLAVALAAPFAMAMFVWSGIKFIRAGSEGNATKITEAKKGLFWSLIGLALLFGAHELINFIKDYFGIS